MATPEISQKRPPTEISQSCGENTLQAHPSQERTAIFPIKPASTPEPYEPPMKEFQHIEFKQGWSDNHHEWVAAFANAGPKKAGRREVVHRDVPSTNGQ